MVRAFIGSDRGGQSALLPLAVRDVLPADHRAWQVLAQVQALDLSAFRAAYRRDGVGRPPYDPAMMLGLLIYCYGKRIRSLRAIRAACIDDLGARLIMGDQVPGLGRLSEFMARHAAAIKGLLPATVAMGEQVGLVTLDVVAGDGTKVSANAAMTATVDEATVRAQITDLEAKVAAATTAWDTQIAAGDGTGSPFGATGLDPVFHLSLDDPGLPHDPDLPQGWVGSHRSSGSGGRRGAPVVTWRQVRALMRMVAARQEALTWLTEHPPQALTGRWRERLDGDQRRVQTIRARVEALQVRLQTAWDQRRAAQAAGTVFLGPPMVPVEHHSHLKREQQGLDKAIARAAKTASERPTATKVNTTDPTSRVMPSKRGGYGQLFNVQALACTGQFVLAITMHDNPNDKQALKPLAAAARANLDTAGITRAISTALFDSGYASQDNLTDPDLPFDHLLIAVEKEARQTGRLTDEVSTARQAWADMAARLADPANAALYKRRSAIIEPLFAQLFQIFGRDLHTRGENALTELHLWAVTHNLDKIARARRRQRRTAA
jgi:transposase